MSYFRPSFQDSFPSLLEKAVLLSELHDQQCVSGKSCDLLKPFFLLDASVACYGILSRFDGMFLHGEQGGKKNPAGIRDS